MKKILITCIAMLVAPAAFAQVMNGPTLFPGNGIIYNLNPMPPIVSNYGMQYAPGTAYLDRAGRPQVCNGLIKVVNESGSIRATCRQLAAPLGEQASAAGLADMAPAAGPVGSPESNLPGDTNLGSDKTAALRSDRQSLR